MNIFRNCVIDLISYVELDEIVELSVTIKIVPISGSGYVRFLSEKKYPNVYNPPCKVDCFFECCSQYGLNFVEGMTLHLLKEKLEIGSSLSVKRN